MLTLAPKAEEGELLEINADVKQIVNVKIDVLVKRLEMKKLEVFFCIFPYILAQNFINEMSGVLVTPLILLFNALLSDNNRR